MGLPKYRRLPRALFVGYSRKEQRGRPFTYSDLGSAVFRFLKENIMSAPLSASEDLYVDGQVEGSISLNTNSLTVGPHGQVKASVEAKGVVVQGKLAGNVQASDRVELRKSAVVNGDISTARISIEEGAFLKGKIDIQGRAEKAAGK